LRRKPFVRVDRVTDSQSLFAYLGLRSGDLVKSVNGQRVETVAEFMAQIRSSMAHRTITVEARHAGEKWATRSFTLPSA
jgi:S1-C subfamily serine protease